MSLLDAQEMLRRRTRRMSEREATKWLNTKLPCRETPEWSLLPTRVAFWYLCSPFGQAALHPNPTYLTG